MSQGKTHFAVIGTGNSGQAYAADISLKGYPVNLAEVPEFGSTLKAIEKKGGIEISGHAANGFARLNMITTNLQQAVAGVDIVIIGGSAFAHEPLSKQLLPFLEDGQFILFTSNFGALRFKKWLRQSGRQVKVTPVETMSLPYAVRALEPGVVSCIGVKSELKTAALPGSRTGLFLEKIKPVFPEFTAADSVWFTSVNNLNPIVHPPMVLFNAGRIEATKGRGWNLYAEGATESVARMMLGIDRERLELLHMISDYGQSFKQAFAAIYRDYDLEKPTLSETLMQSPIHGNPDFPAPDKINTRYLNEDIPFGLVPWVNLSRMWDRSMPNTEAMIQVASTMLETDFYGQGLSVTELGLEGLSPEKVRELLF
ncbi:MAG: NAD/NADP octopine/nopaline dehydrogenase family protein [Spirochaetales bacterium]|nr:NAD/NADP octopine/nopaline dehydrogenase family protein [Spirochaetales bacterium]